MEYEITKCLFHIGAQYALRNTLYKTKRASFCHHPIECCYRINIEDAITHLSWLLELGSFYLHLRSNTHIFSC